jgi:recombination associated protein RdgC
MPIQKGPVSFHRYRLSGEVPKDVRRWLTHALKTRAFEEVDPKGDEDRAAGFVELEQNRRTDFAVGDVFYGDAALFAWRVEKLRVPPAQLKNALEAWAVKFEAEHDRRPGKKERTDEREALRRSLRARVEPSVKVFDVSLNLESLDLFVWATSKGIVEEVQEALETTLKVRLVPRVPSAFTSQKTLDTLEPTPALFPQESGHGA